ncbi:RT RNaseH 2 domain-containing protein [Aphis craccivora]|uniref:RT RNaseH 2 domain-containing protein n=1 Tax=Aphis craccivora TaxID=307492 RepID=A0A6G0YFS2_APHCR|nr:RT RNaseH 2 domain-containing protein [Aphis craccivora]
MSCRDGQSIHLIGFYNRMRLSGDVRISEQNLNHESLSDQSLQKQFATGIVKRETTENILCIKPNVVYMSPFYTLLKLRRSSHV